MKADIYREALERIIKTEIDDGALMMIVIARAALTRAAETDDWQPISTPPDEKAKCLFWVVPLEAHEAYTSSNGKPIVANFLPHVHMGLYRSWSALSKATHWMPLPSSPNQTDTTNRD